MKNSPMDFGKVANGSNHKKVDVFQLEESAVYRGTNPAALGNRSVEA